MAERDRKALICEQATLQVTGIDFARVVDPEVQTRLEVFFLVDPDALDVDPFDLLSAPPAGFARIDAVADDSTFAIAALAWDRVPDAQGELRTVLVIDTEEPGGFQIYRLTLSDDHTPSRIDPFFNAVEFSFKQAAPATSTASRATTAPTRRGSTGRSTISRATSKACAARCSSSRRNAIRIGRSGFRPTSAA